jgi:glycosyltransferase involved in cell wall biosynthesis
MFPDWHWQVLELPPRHFSWRVRGNPLYWAQEERGLLEHEYDLLVATSMVDLATLRGLVPALARLPSALYFHENQFVYPAGGGRHGLLEAQMVSIYSALAADRVLFNSAYNRDSFLQGCASLLKRLPDYTPAETLARLRDRSQVLPVPFYPEEIPSGPPGWPGADGELPARPLRLAWLGRLEHDKGGDGLYRLLEQLETLEVDYELAVVGQQFRELPGEFRQIRADFQFRLVHFGYLEEAQAYRSLLRATDIALSTATHEFQGLAMLEAVAAGCLPLVPDRLAYCEIYPARFRYASMPGTESEAYAAACLLCQLAAELCEGSAAPPDVSGFSAHALIGRYTEIFTTLSG